jgi:hypothetical protein
MLIYRIQIKEKFDLILLLNIDKLLLLNIDKSMVKSILSWLL